jgi:hypothetical protein
LAKPEACALPAVEIVSGLPGRLPICSDEIDLIGVYLADVIADLLSSE